MVNVDMEPSPLKREGYDYGSYTVDGLGETLLEIQTESPWSNSIHRSWRCSRARHLVNCET